MAAGSWRLGLVNLMARLMLRSQYRRIEVRDAGRVPSEGAVLLLANHFSSLVDSMALLETSPRTASFLAKAPLWKMPMLRFFLNATEALPVYRPQDLRENEGRTVRANVETLESCRRRLAKGGSIALFPEGVSQARPRLMPLRTGAARLAIDAGVPVTICPVGLIYDHSRPGHRGTLLVQFGEPWTLSGTDGYASRREGITGTTRRIEAALRGLLAEAPSQKDLDSLRLLRVTWSQVEGVPEPSTLAEAHRLDRYFARSLVALREHEPEFLEELRADADHYRRTLELNGVPPEKLRSRYTVASVLKFLFRRLLPAVIGVPLGLLAAVVTWPIRRVGDLVALRWFGGTEDVRALCRILGGVFLLVPLMLIGSLFAYLRWGPWPAAGVFVGLPALLAFHIVWNDRYRDLATDVRCFFLLAGGNLRKELVRQRQAVHSRLREARSRLKKAGVLPELNAGRVMGKSVGDVTPPR